MREGEGRGLLLLRRLRHLRFHTSTEGAFWRSGDGEFCAAWRRSGRRVWEEGSSLMEKTKREEGEASGRRNADTEAFSYSV